MDGARLVLWGTSFAGGHVLATAASLPPAQAAAVKAIISLVSGEHHIEVHVAGMQALSTDCHMRAVLRPCHAHVPSAVLL